MTSEFGIIGLGVMGKSLARNFAKNGFRLSLYNRHVKGIEQHVAKTFISEHNELTSCKGFDDFKAFIKSLETPRKILVMVNAGAAIDSVITNLINYVEEGDIIIDGGNSNYKKTAERSKLLNSYNIHFIGMGISGGKEGALNGPSLMPGGNKKAFSKIENYLNTIAAKNKHDVACCNYIGDEGAGHFVKMVHNGIEYVEMQLLAEIYSILRFQNELEPTEISNIFKLWNTTELNNYLLESTANILNKKEGDTYLIDLILDKASHKGTGSWTSIAAAELGVPFTLCNAALNARYTSALKNLRVRLSETYMFSKTENLHIDIEDLKYAYQTARILNHYQGLQLISEASKEYHWNINLKNVTSVWTSGCIIASELVYKLTSILENENTILGNKKISEYIKTHHSSLKTIISASLNKNMPIPCLMESLNFLNTITQANSTGNIIQAQRDYFGAHTYKRNDGDGTISYHTNWNNT